jgi:hypothetical protein
MWSEVNLKSSTLYGQVCYIMHDLLTLDPFQQNLLSIKKNLLFFPNISCLCCRGFPVKSCEMKFLNAMQKAIRSKYKAFAPKFLTPCGNTFLGISIKSSRVQYRVDHHNPHCHAFGVLQTTLCMHVDDYDPHHTYIWFLSSPFLPWGVWLGINSYTLLLKKPKLQLSELFGTLLKRWTD